MVYFRLKSVFWLALIMTCTLMLIFGCSGGSNTDTTAPPDHAQSASAVISGTISSLTLSNLVAPTAPSLRALAAPPTPVPLAQLADGNIIVMAVDANSNVASAGTDANRHFSLNVPINGSYVLLYLNSAGQFLGTQVFNSQPGALNATANTDLGNITIANNQAVSSNEVLLLSQTVPSSIATPADITYIPNSTTTINYSLYFPIQNGDLVVAKGHGDSVPGSPDSNDLTVTKTTTEFNGEINKWIFIEWYYRFTSVDVNGIPSGPVINDKLFWYLTDTGRVLWKTERSATETEMFNALLPDTVEIGKVYTIPGLTFSIVELFTQRAIPGGLGTFDGLIAHNIETHEDGSSEDKYGWDAKGVGEVLYTQNQDGTGIHMQVLYKKTGSGSEYGTRPTWLTDALISSLPTIW